MRRPVEEIEIRDAASGLHAFLVLDDLTLGPAAGGVRTRAYASPDEALSDARRLAAAMTIKCSLAGVDAGGGKCVVMDHPGLDRPRAFAALGARIETLGGRFRTAGDLGTTDADLAAMAAATRYVVVDAAGLADAAGRGLLRCVEACAETLGRPVAGLTVAIQGAGMIGAAAAHALAAVGAVVRIADLDASRAAGVAARAGTTVIPADDVLEADVDVLAPCAVGGVITPAVAERVRARALCGAANNLLSGSDAAATLLRRGVVHVPDVVASAGAVTHGVARSIMGLADSAPLVDALGATARAVLAEAQASGRTPTDAAEALALRRIAAARRE